MLVKLTDNQATILFYALEAVQRTLRQDEDGELFTRRDEYYLQTNELEKIGELDDLHKIIEETLDALC